jgi:hypothetical protein
MDPMSFMIEELIVTISDIDNKSQLRCHPPKDALARSPLAAF